MRIFSYIKEKISVVRRLFHNIRRLVSIAWKKYPGTIVALAVIAVLTSLAPFVRTGATALLINRLTSSPIGGVESVLLAILVLLAAMVVPEVLYGIKAYVDKKFWIFTLHDTELQYAKKLADIDVATHEDPKFNDLENRVSENLYSGPNLLGMQFSAVQNTVSLISASAILLFFDPVIFLVMLVGIVPSFIVEARYGHDVWKDIWTHVEAPGGLQ
jgi:ATP-binding cassette subfamily B protein